MESEIKRDTERDIENSIEREIKEKVPEKLNIIIPREKAAYHIYHTARIFFPGTEIKVRVKEPDESDEISESGRAYETITLEELYSERDTEKDDSVTGESDSEKPGSLSLIYRWKGKTGEFKVKYPPGGEDYKRSLYKFLESETGYSSPWGTMIGVRPAGIASSLLSEGKTREEILEYYRDIYLVSDEKALTAYNLALKEREILKTGKKGDVGIYIHMPFCPSRCSYCSFLSYPSSMGNMMDEYITALLTDMETTSQMLKDKNLTPSFIYFGGGTPTAPSDEKFEKVMEGIWKNFIEGNDIREFTVECGRPDSVNEAKLLAMKKYGTTRISINPQTFSDKTLKTVGRNHSAEDTEEIFNLARSLGFSDINMDIILGLPGENREDTENSCKRLLLLRPEGITVHTLSIKKGSQLKDTGINQEMGLTSEMMEDVSSLLEENGYGLYYLYRQKNITDNGENRGYSLKGYENYYNVSMMEDKDTIISCGAGAITKTISSEGERRIKRMSSYKDIRLYLDKFTEVLENKRQMINEIIL